MAAQGETADERGGFAFDSDLDVDVDIAPEPVESAPAPQSSAPADAPVSKQDDGDDLDKASNLDELKAALKKRSPTRDDRAAIDARLAGVSEMERELMELRAWRKAQEEAKAPKKVDEKPVDEWDEMLGKGPEYIRRVAAELAKQEVAQALQQVEALRGEFAAREQAAEFKRQANSRKALIAKHPDAHETLLKFRDEVVKKYPNLEDEALASDDPAAFAYEKTKQYERMTQYKSYEDFIRGEAARLAGEGAPAPAAAPQAAAPAQKPQQRRPLTLAAVRGGNAAVLADDADHFPNF